MTESARSGVIDENEMKLMDNLFDFSDLRAREIMLPRTDMDVLFTNFTLEENLRIVNETKHSRYPVATDNKDRIVGFVHITDLLLAEPAKQRDLTSLVRPIMDVSESMEISQVLRKMQARHEQLALVVDEYGGTAGILTAEKILEEIVGDLYDEFEDERPEIEVYDESFSVDGRMLIEEVNDLTGLMIDEHDVDSIGGWLFKELEGNPAVGKKTTFDGVVFEVEESTRLRVTRVMIHQKLESSFT